MILMSYIILNKEQAEWGGRLQPTAQFLHCDPDFPMPKSGKWVKFCIINGYPMFCCSYTGASPIRNPENLLPLNFYKTPAKGYNFLFMLASFLSHKL